MTYIFLAILAVGLSLVIWALIEHQRAVASDIKAHAAMLSSLSKDAEMHQTDKTAHAFEACLETRQMLQRDHDSKKREDFNNDNLV